MRKTQQYRSCPCSPARQAATRCASTVPRAVLAKRVLGASVHMNAATNDHNPAHPNAVTRAPGLTSLKPHQVDAVTAYRKGDYWHHALATPNTSQAWYGTINVWSSYPPTAFESGEVFVPPATELFQYDQDGNLTNDGRWAFTWDGENRLVKMEPSGTVTAPTGSRRMLEFAYDHQGRRIWERVTKCRITP